MHVWRFSNGNTTIIFLDRAMGNIFSLNRRRCDSVVYSKSAIYNLKNKNKKILNLSNKKLLNFFLILCNFKTNLMFLSQKIAITEYKTAKINYF